MSDPLDQIEMWRELALQVRRYAEHMTTPDGKAELLKAAESWEQKADQAEAGLSRARKSG